MSSAKDNRRNTLELSCINCRKWHSKCDRKKPTCSYCIERNIACVYDRPPKKRGPRDAKTEMQEEMVLMKAELEKYNQAVMYWQTKARMAEQQRREMMLALSGGHPESREAFRLHNSTVFYSLVDMYMLEAFLSYGVKPPFNTLEEFNNALDYSPQKGLMYSILMNASACAGDHKLQEQLEFETKYVTIVGANLNNYFSNLGNRATLGPLFDNSNHHDIPITHFLMSETALTIGDREKWIFYFDIARKSADNFVRKFQHKEEARRLSKMTKTLEAVSYAFEGNWATGLKIVDEYYDYYTSSYPKSNATMMQQTDKMFINLMKVMFEIGLTLSQDDSQINVQQFNNWILLVTQSENILQDIQIPEKLRRNTSMYKSCVKTLLYHAGKQPHFVLENIRQILSAAQDPLCAGSNWTSKIVMIVAGLCLSYCWQDELRQALEILKSCSHRKTIAMAAQAIESIVAQYGSGISFVDYVRMLSSFFDRRSPNPQVSHGIISVSNQGEFVYNQSSSYSNSPISQDGSDGASMEDYQGNTSDLTQVSEYLLEPVIVSEDIDIGIGQFNFNE